MDLWFVAAAAGVGYLAKFWRNIPHDREGSPESHSGISTPIPSDSKSQTPIQQKCRTQNGNNLDLMFSETPLRDTSVPQKVTPISDLDHEKQQDNKALSSSIFLSGSSKHEQFKHREACEGEFDISEIPKYPTWKMTRSSVPEVSTNSLRRKCLHLGFIKPRSSIDSGLMAQMYRKDAEIEDFLLSPLVSPCSPTMRSFLVTDGRQVISKASRRCRNRQQREGYSKADDSVIGVPSLPKFREATYSKLKFIKGKNQMRKSSYVQFDSQGLASKEVFFSVGISIGIVFTMIANKLEVEKLKQSLKQTKNLVEDLQEELEMKDSLTVKELVKDDDSQNTHDNWHGNEGLNLLSMQPDTAVLIKCPKEVNSMSNIEAELEAELERLELSMEESCQRSRLPAAIELDQAFDEDIMAELVHGELTTDLVRRRSSSESSPDRGSSSPSTPLSTKQGISPHELTLRLHEVITYKLEQRIKELELELAKNQKRIQHLESERIISWRDISHSESTTTLGGPITIEASTPMEEPLVMNLSGDALDAYNETYEELDGVKGYQNDQLSNNTNDFLYCTILSNEDSLNDDEETDDVDDLMLIKQIVEKARQGSPAVLRAQKAMIYSNKNED